jgi:hypothetical protein
MRQVHSAFPVRVLWKCRHISTRPKTPATLNPENLTTFVLCEQLFITHFAFFIQKLLALTISSLHKFCGIDLAIRCA